MAMATTLLWTLHVSASAQTTPDEAITPPATASSREDASEKKTLVATVFGEDL